LIPAARAAMRPDATEPDWAARLEDLQAAANQLNIEVEFRDLADPEFPAQSGVCRIHDRHVVLIDRRLPLARQAQALLEALGQFDLSTVYVAAWIRERLETWES